MPLIYGALRAILATGWGLFHFAVWLTFVVLSGGVGLASLLWIVPGTIWRGEGRSAVWAFGWLVWLGPLGLIPALTRRRRRRRGR